MPWLRIDDRFTEHRKIVALKRNDRWTWLELLTYCARQNNNGHVPDGITDVLRWVTPTFLKACVEAGLLDSEPDGYHVHDWNDYNPKDPTKADRQARWRAKRRDSVDTPVDDDVDTPVDRQTTEAVDDRVVAPRAAARARPVPNPLLVLSSSTSDVDPAAAAAALEHLRAAGWSQSQLEAAADPHRAVALLEQCRADPSCHNPAGLAWSKFQSGAQPEPPRSEIAPGASGTRSTSRPVVYPCPECDEILATWSALEDHVDGRHRRGVGAPPPAELQALLGRAAPRDVDDPDPEPAPPGFRPDSEEANA